jgi:hypothetical protein
VYKWLTKVIVLGENTRGKSTNFPLWDTPPHSKSADKSMVDLILNLRACGQESRELE